MTHNKTRSFFWVLLQTSIFRETFFLCKSHTDGWCGFMWLLFFFDTGLLRHGTYLVTTTCIDLLCLCCCCYCDFMIYAHSRILVNTIGSCIMDGNYFYWNLICTGQICFFLSMNWATMLLSSLIKLDRML